VCISTPKQDLYTAKSSVLCHHINNMETSTNTLATPVQASGTHGEVNGATAITAEMENETRLLDAESNDPGPNSENLRDDA